MWAIDDAEVDRSARAHHGFGNLRPKHSTNVDVVVVVHHERGAVGHHEERKKSVGNNELHRNRHKRAKEGGDVGLWWVNSESVMKTCLLITIKPTRTF